MPLGLVAMGVAMASVIGVAALGCGSDAQALEVEHAGGVTLFTRSDLGPSPLTTVNGGFGIEQGCIVFTSGSVRANPVFMPDAKLAEAATAVGRWPDDPTRSTPRVDGGRDTQSRPGPQAGLRRA